MRILFSHVSVLCLIFLIGCSGSKSIGFDELKQSANPTDNLASITIDQRQRLIPALWKVSVDAVGNTDVIEVNWRVVAHSNGQVIAELAGKQIDFTFNNVGLYRFYADYKVQSGQSGSLSYDLSLTSSTIHGEITPSALNQVDIDTQNTAEPEGSNDGFGTAAQQLSVPIILGGNLNVNDQQDIYAVALKENQIIKLKYSDNTDPQNQIKIELFKSSDTGVAVIDGTQITGLSTRQSAIVVQETNSYFIKVSAPDAATWSAPQNGAGEGNYRLEISQPIVSTDFKPGQVLVMYKASEELVNPQFSRAQLSAMGLQASKAGGRQIELLKIENINLLLSNNSMKVSAQWQQDAKWQTLQAIELLKQDDKILFAEPNYKRYPMAVNDPLFSSQWHYPMINLEQAWQLTGRGENSVTVAVLDTGILLTHPDLQANIVHGYDVVGANHDSDATDPGDKFTSGNRSNRSSFHGTHVAGTVAAIADNNIGGTGVAPGVKIMPVRVLGADGGESSDVIDGLCYASRITTGACAGVSDNIATLPADSDAADVINLSLGSGSSSNIEQALINQITSNVDRNIIIVAAAGNANTSVSFYPAAYDNVISVSAVGRDIELAPYSNFGATIDVTAPGGNLQQDSGVWSTVADDSSNPTVATYGALQGTSMAAPHVAGVLALMKSVKPELNSTEFFSLLAAGKLTQDLSDMNKYGRGLIDAKKSVLAVGASADPIFILNRTSFYLNSSTASASFNYYIENSDKISDNSLINTTVSSNQAWLQVNSISGADNDATGSYSFTVDRAGLEDGEHQALITLHSDLTESGAEVLSNSALIVRVQVGNPELVANAGVLHVFLVLDKGENNNQALEQIVEAYTSTPLFIQEGVYKYSLSGIPKGKYFIEASSDLDFDQVICDLGEACGTYPTLSQSKVIEITEEDSLIGQEFNFLVNFNRFSSISSSNFETESFVGKKVKILKAGTNVKQQELTVDNENPQPASDTIKIRRRN